MATFWAKCCPDCRSTNVSLGKPLYVVLSDKEMADVYLHFRCNKCGEIWLGRCKGYGRPLDAIEYVKK